MKIKTSELSGGALDWAVAKAEGWKRELSYLNTEFPNYSGNWSLAGPILEREGIDLTFTDDLQGTWIATHIHWNGDEDGKSPIEAAMRFYVAIKLGEEIDVPEELA